MQISNRARGEGNALKMEVGAEIQGPLCFYPYKLGTRKAFEGATESQKRMKIEKRPGGENRRFRLARRLKRGIREREGKKQRTWDATVVPPRILCMSPKHLSRWGRIRA